MLDFLEWVFTSSVIVLAGWGLIHIINDIWDFINEKKAKRKYHKKHDNKKVEKKTQIVKRIAVKEKGEWVTYDLKEPVYIEDNAIMFGHYLRADKVSEIVEKVEK